ncbi:hypothetical protein ACHAXR_001969, partial [Thalassiosira sp. AJA248-18]
MKSRCLNHPGSTFNCRRRYELEYTVASMGWVDGCGVGAVGLISRSKWEKKMAMTNQHQWRQSILAVLAATAVAGSLLFLSTSTNQCPSFIRQDNGSRRQLASAKVNQFIDPKTVNLRSDAPTGEVVTGEQPRIVGEKSRQYCQIVYIVGVEGSTHHGFIPIIESLARNQQDLDSGFYYNVDTDPRHLKAGLFGWFKGETRKWGVRDDAQMNDPTFVKRVVRESCPNNGEKHILIEWASFPSGQEDDKRTYRVHRQHEWLSMTPEEIA